MMNEKDSTILTSSLNNNENSLPEKDLGKAYPKEDASNQKKFDFLDVEKEKYNILLEQRKQIIDGIGANQKSFNTSIFSILTFMSANYFTTIIAGENMTSVFVFLAVQIVMVFVCYMIALLVAMNNDRDMIRAIDEYIEKEYGVDTFLFQGEIHSQIINKKSNFTYITGLSGLIVTVALLGIVFFFFEEILQYISCYPLVAIVFILEIIGIVVVIKKNADYAKTGKSKIKDDCYKYLYRNNMNLRR